MGRRLLTNKERILFILDNYDFDPDEEYLAPHHTSQEGIANALKMRENNVSREISKLLQDDLVEDYKARTNESQRKRKVYILTDKGKKVKEDIEEKLNEKKILTETKDGKRLEIKIKEALDELEKINKKVEPFHIAEWMRSKDILDIENFKIPPRLYKKDSKSKENVELLINAPKKKEICGREEELRKIKNKLNKEKPPIIVIEGLPGIGKTVLGRKILDEHTKERNVFWYSFHRWERASDFVEELKRFVTDLTKKTIDMEKSPSHIAKNIAENLRDTDTLLLFDNCESMPEKLSPFMEMLVREKRKGNDLSIIIMTRKTPDFYDVRDEMQENIFKLELGPIKKENAEDMITEDVTKKDLEEIYEKTRGHPMYLELIERFQKPKNKMSEFLEREIYSKLSEEKSEFLKLLSLFQNPVKKDILLDKGDLDILSDLKNDNILTETNDGKIDIHEILKKFFRENISIEKRKKLHRFAAEKLIQRDSKSTTNKMEVLYHLVQGEEYEKAIESMENLIEELAGLPKSIKKKTIELPLDELSEKQKGKYFSILGDLFSRSKDWNKAVDFYERAIKILDETGKISEKLGKAQMKLEKWDETIQTHDDNLELYEKKDDKEGMFREYLSLGTVYRKKGEFKKSKRYYEKARSVMNDLSKKEEKSSLVLNNLGMLHLAKKEYNESEKKFKKALKKNGKKSVIHENLAHLYEKLGEKERSLDELERAIQLTRKKNNLKETVELMIKKADSLLYFKEFDKTENVLKKSLEIEENRTSRFWQFSRKKSYSETEAKIYERLADLKRKTEELGDSKKYRLKSIEAYDSLGNTEKKNFQKLLYCFDLADNKKFKEALEVLEKLEKKLEKQQYQKGITAVKLEKARVLIQKGKYRKSKDLLKNIIKNANKKQDEKAVKEAKRILDDIV